MKINVLPATHPAVMTMMSFPEINPMARQWVSTQLQQGSELLTDFAVSFLNKAVDMYRSMNDGTLERTARMVTRGIKSLLHPNTILPLYSVQEVQSAKPIMQRYIMAEPEIRSIFHRQLCDGFSDSYHDAEPGKIGDDHYDYRRVMHGIVQDTIDENDQPNFKISYYFEDLHEGDRDLSPEEQFIILDVWDVVRSAIATKVDPTDIFNSDLGI